jgi:hypothetical protein
MFGGRNVTARLPNLEATMSYWVIQRKRNTNRPRALRNDEGQPVHLLIGQFVIGKASALFDSLNVNNRVAA